MTRTWMTALMALCLMGAPVFAQEQSPSVPMDTTAPIRSTSPSSRGSLLPSLYVGLAALQAYDGFSTRKAISRGGVEVNPLMGPIASRSAALYAVKAATTAASIYAAERLWRQHHRVQAVALMAVTNGLMAAVATHNASVVRGLR